MFKDIASISATSIFVYGLNFISGVLTARMLLPEGRGLLAEITYYVPIISYILSLSLREVAIYFSSEIDDTKRNDYIVSLLLCSIFLSLLSLIISLVFQLLYFNNFRGLLFLSSFVYSIQAPMLIISDTLLGFDLGLGNIKRYNLVRFVASMIYTSGIVFLYFINIVKSFSKEMLIFGVIISILFQAFSTLFLRVCFFRKFFKSLPCIINNFSEYFLYLKSIVYKSLKFHASSLPYFFTKQIDKLFVIQLFSPKLVGFYIVTWNLIFTIMSLFFASVSSVTIPYVRKGGNFRQLLVRLMYGGSFLCFISVFIIKHLVQFIYGIEYKPVENLLPVVSIFVFFLLFRGIQTSILKAIKKETIAIMIEIGILAFLIALLISLKVSIITLSIYELIYIFILINMISSIFLVSYLFRKSWLTFLLEFVYYLLYDIYVFLFKIESFFLHIYLIKIKHYKAEPVKKGRGLYHKFVVERKSGKKLFLKIPPKFAKYWATISPKLGELLGKEGTFVKRSNFFYETYKLCNEMKKKSDLRKIIPPLRCLRNGTIVIKYLENYRTPDVEEMNYILATLSKNGYYHADLRKDNFAVYKGKIYLLDIESVIKNKKVEGVK